MMEAFIAFCFLSVARCCQVPSFRLWTQAYNSLWEGVSELQQNNVESWLLGLWTVLSLCFHIRVSSRVYIHMYSPYDQAWNRAWDTSRPKYCWTNFLTAKGWRQWRWGWWWRRNEEDEGDAVVWLCEDAPYVVGDIWWMLQAIRSTDFVEKFVPCLTSIKRIKFLESKAFYGDYSADT